MGVDEQSLEPNADGSNRGELMRSLAEDGYEMIIGVGFAFAEDMDRDRGRLPGHQVRHRRRRRRAAQRDRRWSSPRSRAPSWSGAEAALKSGTGKIGFIGGVEIELIQKFEAGFVAGAKAADPDVEVEVKYITPDGDFTGFDDPAKGKTIADGMYEDGNDVDLPRAPASPASACSRRPSPPTASPSASTPTSTSGADAARAEVHPHLDAEAGRRRRVQRHRAVRQRSTRRRRRSSAT